MPQLLWVHAWNAGDAADPVDDPGDDVSVERAAVVGDQPVVDADVLEVGGSPVGEQVDQLRVQRHVAVGAELAERDAQPMVGADLHHRIRGEVDQFTGAYAGAGQHFHDQPVPRVAASAGDGHHLGGGLVVEEARQRFRSRRQVPVQDRVAGGCVGPVPFDDPLEEHPQGAQPLPMRVRRGLPAADSGAGGQWSPTVQGKQPHGDGAHDRGW